MIRRNILMPFLCTTTIAAAGFAIYAPTTFARPAGEARMSAMTSEQRENCLKACAACADACGKASEHCMSMAVAGKGDHAAMSALCADCGTCCASCLAFVGRNSQLSPVMAECCAKCCDQTAAACDKIGGAEMIACAKACRECAAACRTMAK